MTAESKHGSNAFPRGYPDYKARQGELVLRTRLQRAIFVVGLAGLVIAATVMSLLR